MAKLDLKGELEREAAALKKKALEAVAENKSVGIRSMNPTDAEKEKEAASLRARQDERKAKKYFQTHERLNSTGQLDALGGSGLQVRTGDASIRLKKKDNKRAETSYKKELRDERKAETKRERDAKAAKDGKDGKGAGGKDGKDGKDAASGNTASSHKDIDKANSKASKKSDDSQLTANEIVRLRELLQKV